MTRNIDEILEEGRKLYNQENYEEALDKFKEAKALDTGGHTSHCDYGIGSSYFKLAKTFKLAETTKNVTQKGLYNAAIYFLKLVPQDDEGQQDDENQYEDINTLIATAYDNIGDKQQALIHWKKTKSYIRINEIEQELGINSNKEIALIQDNSISVNKTYKPFQNRDNRPLSPQETTEILYKMSLVQCSQEQRINNLEYEFKIIKEKLHIAGIDTQVNINNKIIELNDKKPELYKYYNYFNMGLQNIYLASKVIASGLVVPDAGHMERKQFIAIEKSSCYLADILGCGLFGPWISAIFVVGHDAIDNIFNTSAEKKLKVVLGNFYNIAQKMYDHKLSIEQNIQQLVLLYTHIKEKEILSIKATSTQEGIINFITKKLLPAQQKIFDVMDQDTEDPVIELAFKDLTALMTYIQDKSEEMIASRLPFVVQIANVIEKELDKYYYDKIKNSQVNSIEYTLEQIENNLPESTKINKRIEEGQWGNIPLSFISIDLWSFWSLDISKIFRISWKGEQRGIENFCDKEYFRDNCNNKNITDAELDNCMLLLFHKICKSGNEECIRYFKDKNGNIIELALKNAPQLFVTAKAIDICIADQEQQAEAKEVLRLKNPKQFFADCFKKIFPNIDIEKINQEEQARSLLNDPNSASNLIDCPSPRSDSDDDTGLMG